MQSRLFTIPFLLLVVISLFTTSCSKEEVPTKAELLPGTWDANSFMVSGQETIGTSMNAFVMNFGEYNGTEGTVVFTTTKMDGDIEVENATYSLNDSESVLTIASDEETINFNFTVTETSTIMDGVNSTGTTYVIAASK